MTADSTPELRPYVGRWVAVVANRVAGSGPTPAAARQMAARNRPKERALVGVVALKENGVAYLTPRLPLSPILDVLRPMLTPGASAVHDDLQRHPVFLVGGAVRDALLGRASHDLDFATAGDAVGVARAVADRLGASFYLLDAERSTGRVVVKEIPGSPEKLETIVLDFARFRGDSLLSDLSGRDFTINAMALPIESSDAEGIIDPLGGQHDLADGVIRSTGPEAMASDPVRCLRAVRQASEFGFDLDPETRWLIAEGATHLPTVSVERVRDELCRLLGGPKPAASLRLLDELDLLCTTIPELQTIKGLAQPAPHTGDPFSHTLMVIDALERLLAWLLPGATPSAEDPEYATLEAARQQLGRFGPDLGQYLERPTAGGRSGRALLFLAALLHDVGKAETYSVDEDGRIHFLGHEQRGALLANCRARALAMSNDEVRQVVTIVRHHMRPAWLAHSSPDAIPPRRSIYRLFRDTGDNGLDVCLICLADAMGKGAAPLPDEWQVRLRVVTTLMEHFFLHRHETIAPVPLLGGRQLMAVLQMPPGPEVGRLLEIAREAQAAGEVSTVEDALLLVRRACGPGRG